MIQKQLSLQTILIRVVFICTPLIFVGSVFSQSADESFQEISTDSTFDIVTWNIEWFGSETNGPDDVDLQMKNVIKLVETIDADLYALQEIANAHQFEALIDSLEDYRGFRSYYGQAQQTAYLFKNAVIDSLDSGYLVSQQSEHNWAGRLPLFFEFDVSISGQKLKVFSYNIHAKAFADQQSYNRRYNAAKSLKQYLDRSRQNASVVVLGDFNDQLTTSTFEGEPSPYAGFVEDDFYLPVTKPLEEEGEASYLDERYLSFIDHIIVTNVLKSIHITGSQQVANVDYIGDFQSTTSDHAPVWTRFDFTRNFDDPYEELPKAFVVGPNYPNPFNPSTTIPFELDEPKVVTVTVYDIMGREIAILSKDQAFNAGKHTLTFNAEGLTSGIYLFRVELGTGQSRTHKMTLIK